MEPVPPHLRLRLRAGDPQRLPGRLRARRFVAGGHRPPRPGPSQLDLHGRPPRGRIWFRWFLPETTPVTAHRPGGPHPGGTGTVRDRIRGERHIVTGRPPPVVLDDLASPRFSPEIDQLRAAMADMAPGCPLGAGSPVPRPPPSRPGTDDFGDAAIPVPPRDPLRCAAGGGRPQRPGCRQLVQPAAPVPQEPAPHPGPADPSPRDPRHPRSSGPIIICGLPRTGTTHLHNLIGADPGLALPALLGEPRAGTGRRRAAGAGRARSPPGPHRVRPRRAQRRAALLQPDARDDRRPRARGDPAPGHRRLDHAVRDPGAVADVARLLQGARTRPRPTSTSAPSCRYCSGSGRRALGPQVTPAPRTVRPARCRPSPTPPSSSPTGTRSSVTVSMATMVAYTSRMSRRARRPVAIGALLVGAGRGPVPGLRRRP